jgi:hypothetical protein
MEHAAPLIQTVLWVGLIAGIVWRFHEPIYGLLVALQKSIEAGSSIKAGPFELTNQLKPQNALSQKERAATEVQEVLRSEPAPLEASTPDSERIAKVQARYFQAEDLVLRAMQSEYGAPMNRQVTAGRDAGFDGVFLSAGRINVVEVKYIADEGSVRRFKVTIDRLTHSIQQYGWTNAQIVLALVFEHPEKIGRTNETLSAMFSANVVPVVVRCYGLADLQAQYGVGEQREG